jgi:thiosulfate reductase cytochrome b subunit
MKRFVKLFKRFERLWHWLQATLVILLIVTGLELHGLFMVSGFELSVDIHNIAAFIWSGLILMIFTWIFTTGEWKQYVPSLQGIDGVLRYYLHGVFVGESHPHHATPEHKFNPVQRFSYIVILFILLPLQIFTGFVFYFFPDLRAMGIIGQIDLVAILHTFTAYSFLAFLIIHLYMITFGQKLSTHIKAMITGVEELDEEAGKTAQQP